MTYRYFFAHTRLTSALSVALFCLILVSCDGDTKKKETSTENASDLPVANALKPAPEFNADSAYNQVKKQVEFGPRVPSTKAHKLCADYLITTFKRYGVTVQEQPFVAKTFDGKSHQCRNIIASVNPEATKRILLAAHWDTRPFADQDVKDQDKPIDGANDGGSGVAVLLELARVLQKTDKKLAIGVDFILFDAEDYGETDDYEPKAGEEPAQWWCLGSKYWSANKHQANYSAYFGILLDMVGNRNAIFGKEGASMEFAPSVVTQVWETGRQLGYSSLFSNTITEAITDDHIAVNRTAKINMIDIIEYDKTDGAYFSNTWHTHNDNIHNIDPKTLKAVGQTVLQVLYQQ